MFINIEQEVKRELAKKDFFILLNNLCLMSDNLYFHKIKFILKQEIKNKGENEGIK
jgi:hypothetical protein